jgi:hypothetical protein
LESLGDADLQIGNLRPVISHSVRNAAHRETARKIDVLFLNWRDLRHPEGGGSEQYVHRVAEGLAATGLRVRLFCAAHRRAPADEVVRGVHLVRRGGRFGVYPRGLAHVCRHRPRLVVDVQNGVPFASPLVTRAPVVVLLHHVHREQCPIVFGRLVGAAGWWVESPSQARRARHRRRRPPPRAPSRPGAGRRRRGLVGRAATGARPRARRRRPGPVPRLRGRADEARTARPRVAAPVPVGQGGLGPGGDRGRRPRGADGGLPVSGRARESVLDGRTGVLVGDPRERTELGAAARRRAADRTWRATALAFGEVLAEALGSDPGGEPA